MSSSSISLRTLLKSPANFTAVSHAIPRHLGLLQNLAHSPANFNAVSHALPRQLGVLRNLAHSPANFTAVSHALISRRKNEYSWPKNPWHKFTSRQKFIANLGIELRAMMNLY